MVKRDELYDKTKELQLLNNESLYVFKEQKENPDSSPDFFEEVKPFADTVKALADEWKPLAEEWVLEDKPTYFYVKQIEDTHENLLISSVLAFQATTKEKRFREMIQSIDYIMTGILNELTK